MFAIRMHERGGPERMEYEQVAVPVLQPGEALVRVRAAGITPSELGWEATWTDHDGRSRLPSTPSHEVCGDIVKTVGAQPPVVVGECVFGLTDFYHDGAAAEYMTVAAASLAPRPKSLDDVHAAALPLSGLTAWQALFDHGLLEPDQRVLILGAAGGVGTFAVQLVQFGGAYAIATAVPSDAEFVSSLGANEIVGYDDFISTVKDVDLVLDLVGGEILERSWSVLRRGGTLVSIVDRSVKERADAFGVRGDFFVVAPNRDQLMELGALVDAGKLKVIVANEFPLSKAREAYEFGLHHHVRGKIVLDVISS